VGAGGRKKTREKKINRVMLLKKKKESYPKSKSNRK
jgi:hypothetical protein